MSGMAGLKSGPKSIKMLVKRILFLRQIQIARNSNVKYTRNSYNYFIIKDNSQHIRNLKFLIVQRLNVFGRIFSIENIVLRYSLVPCYTKTSLMSLVILNKSQDWVLNALILIKWNNQSLRHYKKSIKNLNNILINL
jgi:hypothetical protein